MINYIEKGVHLHAYISEQGYKLWNEDGVFKSDNDVEVQAIIDSFDPLSYAQDEAYLAIDKAAGETRLRYAPDLLLAEEYRVVKEQVVVYQDSGVIGSALQAAADYDNLTVDDAATLVMAKSNALTAMLEAVRSIRLVAKKNIRELSAWSLCKGIADTAVTQLESI